MAIITNIPTTWTAIGAATTAPETWQCTDGAVCVSTEAAPADDDGIRLEGGRGVQISAGKTVQYRRVSESAAIIRREKL